MVIVIIGILATLATVAVNGTRARARDAKRISDIKQIQTALELYMADENTYPSLITPGQAMIGASSAKTYMVKVPDNPTPRTEGSCPDSNYGYGGNGSDYILTYCLNQRTTQATTSINVASNKTTNGTVAESPVSVTATYCTGFSWGCENFPTTSSLIEKTINLDNQFGLVYFLDLWSDAYFDKGAVWNFGSSKNRSINIKWKASFEPKSNSLPMYRCINIQIIFETSLDNSNWTIQKTLSYTSPAQNNSPIIVIPDQLEVFNGDFQYLRIKVSSAADNACLVLDSVNSYLGVDGIVSY